jgi:hypothetical protein
MFGMLVGIVDIQAPSSSKASRTVSAVIGDRRILAPVAFEIALAITTAPHAVISPAARPP